MDTERLLHLISSFRGHRVLVLGDMVADEYIVGRPARISREAPVLVLHHIAEFVRPGGAANVALNLSALGAETIVAGVVGDDVPGRRLRESLCASGIDDGGLIVASHRPTSTKTRIVARGTQEMQQQIVRVDRVDLSAVTDDVSGHLIACVDTALKYVDAVVISDYENGVINPSVLSSCLPKAAKREMVVTVDSHGDLLRFRGVTVATPNQPEAEATLGIEIRSVEDLEDAGRRLLAGMEAAGVLVTRGSEGMSLFERNSTPRHLPVMNPAEVLDPAGAGDTVSAVFTLALLAGATMAEAALLSDLAAGQVVKKLGAAVVSPEELAVAAEAMAAPTVVRPREDRRASKDTEYQA